MENEEIKQPAQSGGSALNDGLYAKWRPSNDTECDVFISGWCNNCKKDVNEACEILARTFIYDVEDEKYPNEWRYGEHGSPECAAFEGA